jgi:hypothetical protein
MLAWHGPQPSIDPKRTPITRLVWGHDLSEFLAALQTLVFGLFVCMPFESFIHSSAYSWIIDYVSEYVAGVLFVAVGIVSLGVWAAEWWRGRKVMTMVQLVFWVVFIVLTTANGDWRLAGPTLMYQIPVQSLVAYIRLGTDRYKVY